MAHYVLRECIGAHRFRDIAKIEGGQAEITRAVRAANIRAYVVVEVPAPAPEPEPIPEPKAAPAKVKRQKD